MKLIFDVAGLVISGIGWYLIGYAIALTVLLGFLLGAVGMVWLCALGIVMGVG